MRISQTFDGQSGELLREEEWFLKGVEYYDIGKIALGAPLSKPSDEDDASVIRLPKKLFLLFLRFPSPLSSLQAPLCGVVDDLRHLRVL